MGDLATDTAVEQSDDSENREASEPSTNRGS